MTSMRAEENGSNSDFFFPSRQIFHSYAIMQNDTNCRDGSISENCFCGALADQNKPFTWKVRCMFVPRLCWGPF